MSTESRSNREILGVCLAVIGVLIVLVLLLPPITRIDFSPNAVRSIVALYMFGMISVIAGILIAVSSEFRNSRS